MPEALYIKRGEAIRAALKKLENCPAGSKPPSINTERGLLC
ncbi:16920_t:CDS:2 [Dentiscutata heterogama]|uniref:16920_t:CDS:1 n=1 Tax=Dentiscutata heterogama TaxID=1316150 RepID=A0ACA9KEK4_9GLOM|nr:16920_t:CDS:2 [Dentiscutata heterogama]